MYDGKRGTKPPKNSQGSPRRIGQEIRQEDLRNDSTLYINSLWDSGLSTIGWIGNQMKKLHKLITSEVVMYLNLIVIGFAVLLYGYWYFLDGTVIHKVLSQQTPLTYQTTKAYYNKGEEVLVKSSLCKYRAIPAKVDMFLTDTISLPYPQRTNNLPVGCNLGKFGIVFAKLPQIAPAGIYHLDGTFTYQVNPVKTLTISFKTNEFQIIDYEGFTK